MFAANCFKQKELAGIERKIEIFYLAKEVSICHSLLSYNDTVVWNNVSSIEIITILSSINTFL